MFPPLDTMIRMDGCPECIYDSRSSSCSSNNSTIAESLFVAKTATPPSYTVASSKSVPITTVVVGGGVTVEVDVDDVPLFVRDDALVMFLFVVGLDDIVGEEVVVVV